MSTNEVTNIQKAIKNFDKIKANSVNPQDNEIQVFGSDNVSAKVNLNSEENNSLFSSNQLINPNPQAEIDLPVNNSFVQLSDEIKQKYPTEKEQTALSNLTEEQFNTAKKLMDTKLGAINIAAIVKIFKPEQVDKIKSQVEAMQDATGGKDKVYAIAIGNDAYDKKAYVLNCLDYNSNLKTNVLDENLETRSIEKLQEFTTEDGKKYRMKEAYDLKSGALSKVKYDYDDKYKTFIAKYEIRSKINPDGTMISREYSKPSDLAGIFTTKKLTKDGIQDLSNVRVKRNGKVVVKKDMESLDGTRTQYSYKDDPKGNRYLRYKITTKDGEVLMNNTKSFTVVSDSEFKSTFNDKSYTMSLKDNVLTVVDDNDKNRKAEIKFDDIKGDKDGLISTLKQMSGEELLALNKTTTSLEGIDSVLKSYYQPADKSLHSGDNMFVVLHELGHAKDFQHLKIDNVDNYIKTLSTMISQNKDLKKTFEAEKAAFNKEFPDSQREHIDYFINTLTHYSGPDGGLKETTAESNAIHTTPKTHEMLTLRTQYLQQYYPRTMAKLNELLNQNRPAPKFNMDILDLKIEAPTLKYPGSKKK